MTKKQKLKTSLTCKHTLDFILQNKYLMNLPIGDDEAKEKERIAKYD